MPRSSPPRPAPHMEWVACWRVPRRPGWGSRFGPRPGSGPGTSPFALALLWSVLFPFLLMAPRAFGAQPLSAQDGVETPVPVAESDSVPDAPSGFRFLGHSYEDDRLIGGIWAVHPLARSFPRIDATYGYGFNWNGFYGARLRNSYNRTTFTFGVERWWLRPRWWILEWGLGYRAGIITGYDERIFELAAHTPVLPIFGFQSWVRVGPARFDVFYVYRAVTLEVSAQFPLPDLGSTPP